MAQRKWSVKLTEQEMNEVGLIGLQRQNHNILNTSRKDRTPIDPPKAYGVHVVGILGEYAVAKMFGITFEPSEFRGDDVAGCEVRTTHWERGRLIIKPKDKDDDIILLVTFEKNVFVLRGWGRVKELRGVGELKGSDHWVNQNYLKPMDQLDVDSLCRMKK